MSERTETLMRQTNVPYEKIAAMVRAGAYEIIERDKCEKAGLNSSVIWWHQGRYEGIQYAVAILGGSAGLFEEAVNEIVYKNLDEWPGAT